MNLYLIGFYIGLFIIFASHLYNLIDPENSITMAQHSYANLIAGFLIVLYVYQRKQK